MKRKLLIGLCILVALAVGWLIMYHGTIQNVFDEMYYGYRSIFPSFLYPVNYNGFGFSRISPVERDMFAERDAFVEHSSKWLTDEGEVLRFLWFYKQKTIRYAYVTLISKEPPFGQSSTPAATPDSYLITMIATYHVKENKLVFEPLRLSSNGESETHNFSSVLARYSLTKADVEQLINTGFLERITNRWFEINEGKTRFSPEDLGEITIENHLLDSIPE